MRILIFAPWSFSTAYYTAKYCNAISESGLDVYLIVPHNFLFNLLHKNITIVNWGNSVSDKSSFMDIIRTPYNSIRLIRILKRINPDWFHILWIHHIPALISLFLKKYKVAYTVHDPILHHGESGKIRNWVQNKIIRSANIYFVHGQENKRLLLDKYKMKEHLVFDIPHGEFIFWDKEQLNIKQEKIILFFGRIKKYKGIDILLDAFEKIHKIIPQYKLLIVGQGDVHELLPKINKIPNIELVNRYIEHDEAATFLLRSTFVVLPYVEATQSGVIPMVFALGRTCIASNVGAISEIVKNKENGLLVKPSDQEELAASIFFLIENESLRIKMEINAFDYIKKASIFSWQKTAEIAHHQYLMK